MKNNNDLFIIHLFDAEPALVFDAWTQPDHLKNWYAPDGCTIAFKSIDVRVSGEFHFCIDDPVHGDCWIKGRYDEIIVNELLVFSMILTNENGDTVTADEAGKSADWPQAIVTTVTFTPVGNQTKVSVHQTVAEEEAKKTGAYQSWFSMYDKLSYALKTA